MNISQIHKMRMCQYFCFALVLIARINASPVENPGKNINEIMFPGDPAQLSVEWNNKTILFIADGSVAMNPEDSPSNADNVDSPPFGIIAFIYEEITQF